MKRIFLVLAFFLLFFNTTYAADVNLYLFSSNSCPHCRAERQFLDDISSKYPELTVYDFEVSDPNNIKAFKYVASSLNASANGVPFTVIGTNYFTGFGVGYSDQLIEDEIQKCIQDGCEDFVGKILGLNQNIPEDPVLEPESDPDSISISEPEKVEDVNGDIGAGDDKELYLPVIGDFKAKEISLPFLAVVVGLLDGFNPCAMWVLIFLITMLIGMENKKRRWTLGIVFIVASAFVYFVFMAAWLELILFFSFIAGIRIAIGLIAVIGGSYSLKKGFEPPVCKISSGDKQQKTFEKIKEIVKKESLWLSLGGIIILAFVVNLVELVCSAGFPAVFTQVLAINELPRFQYYIYILIYIFFFMLDDLIVFILAMKTLEVTGLTTKYSKITRIVGGLLMLIIGILLIFRPEFIMFG